MGSPVGSLVRLFLAAVFREAGLLALGPHAAAATSANKTTAPVEESQRFEKEV